MNVLFLGDVVGKPGREAVAAKLPAFKRFQAIDFCVANGENSADGDGITAASAEELFSAGVDVVTGGNHSFKRREAYDYLNEAPYVLRPANYSPDAPGKGVCQKAFSSDEAVIVDDVHAFPGHIACDAASRSEIVIPLHRDGIVIGVLDIDSPIPARFTNDDLRGLKEVAAVLE